MKNLVIVSIILLTVVQTSFAQKQLPILKTNTKTLNIREGNVLHENLWDIDPQIKRDEFVANAFKGKNTIHFYSDIDTLSIAVVPNKHYDFIVLLNGKEKAYTRISTDFSKPPSIRILDYYHKDSNETKLKDTIPFKLVGNRIHISGKINGSDSLNFMFDTGAGTSVITSSLIGNKVQMDLDGETENVSSTGISTVKTSTSNTLEIGNLVWDNVEFSSIDYKNRSFDGILGWTVFQQKVVEIEYENNQLIIHQSMNKIPKGYSKLKTRSYDGVFQIQAEVAKEAKWIKGWFLFDTGSDGTLSMSQKFTKENDLETGLERIGSATSEGSNGIVTKSTRYLIPKLKLGGYETYLIPGLIKEKDSKTVEPHENIGNQIIKRFNVLFDMINYEIYIKPNKLIHSSY